MERASDIQPSFATLGERIERLREDEFVGRSFELRFFEDYLTHLPERIERIVNVHGTGGMGKTVLLERFRAIAAARGALYVHIDLRGVQGGSGQIAAIALDQIRRLADPGSGADADDAGAEALAERCADALGQLAAARKVVLAFDHYEEIGSLDDWLRETFLPRLHANILVVIAGRFPLEGPWRLSPAWRKLTVALPVSEWSYDDAMAYLTHCGVADETARDLLWIRTLGHPLSLVMAASAYAEGRPAAVGAAAPAPEWPGAGFEELVRRWLDEAKDDELRELVMAASVTRAFHPESLSEVTGRGVSPSLFDRLVRLSFVERSAGGWSMHELARETVRRSFRERYPDRFAAYAGRAVVSLREKIAAELRCGRDISREAAELLGLVGNPILRAHFRHSRASRHYWETVGEHNADDAEAYIRRRADTAKDCVVRCSDPETGELFRFRLTAGESLLQLKHVNVRELVRHGGERALRLLRSPEGEAAGLVALLPIGPDTLPYLKRAPLSRAFFAAQPGHALGSLCEGGKFLYAADVIDPENEELRSDVVRLKLAHMLSGSVLIASPPHLPYYAEAHRSLGFAPVPGAEHADYDGVTLTPTYRLDTRGGEMAAFLDRVTDSAFSLPVAEEPGGGADGAGRGAAAPALTPREAEVAELLALGHTNAEIAAALYLSVAAVKKHVNSMLHKYGLKNRTQLAKALPAGSIGGSAGREGPAE
ncbi:LuxR family transcriptional regulator [Paenibacillus sp. GYB003]|uniref:LuxR family transcriptional regulator n=1 Tax=Paenibacillus sp. GYB003 TaxID=2994392 RepID=UPI002F968E22